MCKVIIDSGSSINAISTDIVSRLELLPIDHPSLYKVLWIDTSLILILTWCLVLIQFHFYQDQVWCDVLPMAVGNLILGRLWLFDMDVTLYGRSNSCLFEHNDKRIPLNTSPPRTTPKKTRHLNKCLLNN